MPPAAHPAVATLAAAVLVLAACDTTPNDDAGGPEAIATAVEAVDADEAVSLLADRDDLTVIDVRTPEEHAEGHIAGTVLVDAQAPDLEAKLDVLDPGGAYLVYCRTGNRSAAVAATMAERGFVEVYDAQAFADLAAAGAPTATGD